jgi:ferritin-like metal-binding protein YciE
MKAPSTRKPKPGDDEPKDRTQGRLIRVIQTRNLWLSLFANWPVRNSTVDRPSEERRHMGFQSLNDVLEEQLEDLHSAETQLVQALPKMAQAAHHDELRDAFKNHLEQTHGHLTRVEEALGTLGVAHPTEECKAMKGLIAEGEELIQTDGDPIAKDAALIAAAQRVEHYEIAAYGTARQLAGDCGYDTIKDLMDQTLDEESQADKLLTKIATGGMFKAGVNQRARA